MASKAEETFTSALGDSMVWDESWQCLAQIDPEIFHASVNLIAVPRKKNHLSAKMQALVALTVDSNSTHLYTPGIRQHIKAAAAAGATKAEVLEVLELSSTLGIHACNIGIPTLVQVLKEENMYDSHPTAGKPFDEKRLALKEDFAAKRGYWHSFWEDFLALDPEFFEAYTEFSSVPWTRRIGGITDHAGALPNQVNGSRSKI
jgi:alkylhydroperoxidase/carboxymuconolactone decarboxylase family protein YurZ